MQCDMFSIVCDSMSKQLHTALLWLCVIVFVVLTPAAVCAL